MSDRTAYASRCPFAAGLLLACASAPAPALDYQFHGFISQGYALSEGNNALGSSMDGSTEYYEAGLTGALAPLPNLLISAQALRRDAGAGDDGRLRLDYGLVDYRFFSGADLSAGLRAGRVKNPFGFFNDTRDVVFTRPGILLPSAYAETLGARHLLFSSDGGQFYGTWALDRQTLSAVAGAAVKSDVPESEQELILGDLASFGDLHSDHLYVLRLSDALDLDSGAWEFALSYLHGDLDFEPNPGVPFAFDVEFSLYLLSLRYHAADYTITSEYNLTALEGSSSFGDFEGKSDGIYLQGDYLLSPKWTLMARYDAAFQDRNDRSGSDCRDRSGQSDRYRCFAHDLTLGTHWLYDAHWGVWGEGHYIVGRATVPSGDNQEREGEDHWSLFLLMAAYRF